MLKVKANAKINLFLEITGKSENGYHTVDTVMQSVSLSDSIELELAPKKEGILISCNVPGVPVEERNIAHKTAKAYLDTVGADCGINIKINKSIPAEAGMGGGSADGAAVLLGLNELFGNALSDGSLESLAAKFGADIPFCIKGGTKRLSGIGADIVSEYRSPEIPLVIAKPVCGISTPIAYRCLDVMFNNFTDHSAVLPERLLAALSCGEDEFSGALYNRFESVLDELCPISKNLIEFLNNNSHAALLCGSGAAVFAMADSFLHAERLAELTRKQFENCSVWVASTASDGCSVI